MVEHKQVDKKLCAVIDKITECDTLREARALQKKLPKGEWREDAEEIIQCRKEEAV